MSAPTLSDRFASDLPELTIDWQADAAPDARLLVLNEPLASELGLDPTWLGSADGVRFLIGNALPEGAHPVAQAYAGHQFGGYTPRLGDGRALLLGELATPGGAFVDLHLKGSGRTPFSRGGDGLAAVGPMLRELVISEAMHALGIPTTRSLAVVATGRAVAREEGLLPGAVLTRVASSHLRVGSFQYARATGDLDLLRRLTDHAIARHHPSADGALGLLSSVVEAQASLVAQWMAVGFVHGVMNTDNTTISGESIDYGPCAFMEAYDPATVFSSIDHGGRYAFGNQPLVAEWNLARLAESLLPLIAEGEDEAIAQAVEVLKGFSTAYAAAHARALAAKLGLAAPEAQLAADLLAQLAQSRVDWTSFWRDLARAARGDAEPARGRFLDLLAFDAWTARWLALAPDADLMDRTNPVYVPRNQLVEQALAAGTEGDLAPLGALLQVLAEPFTERPGLEAYALPSEVEDYRTFCGT